MTLIFIWQVNHTNRLHS